MKSKKYIKFLSGEGIHLRKGKLGVGICPGFPLFQVKYNNYVMYAKNL